MKKTGKILPVLGLAVMLTLGMTGTAFAESYDYDGVCNFDGSKMVESFDGDSIASRVSNLQPGDDVTFTIEYKNYSSESTDWYMENAIARTLESLDKARTAVRQDGVDNPADGGYTYELIQYDHTGAKNVLFSNSKVGGENGTVADLDDPGKEMTGLEPATNALDDWFYIDTLKKNESGSVVLHVAFDGETEVNDYMDTDGELNVRFAVELTPEGTGVTTTSKIVKTGDQTNLLMWAVIGLIAGLLMLMLAFLSRKKDEKSKGGEA